MLVNVEIGLDLSRVPNVRATDPSQPVGWRRHATQPASRGSRDAASSLLVGWWNRAKHKDSREAGQNQHVSWRTLANQPGNETEPANRPAQTC